MKIKLIRFYLFYLRFFARLQLMKIRPTIIGIGGASGKSSVSLFVHQILSDKYRVKESKGKNSETGIPLNILDIDAGDYSYITWLKIILKVPFQILLNNKKYDYYVCEMGIDSPYPPKNMEYLLSIIKPDIGVVTNINIEHSQNFDIYPDENDERVRKEKILEFIGSHEKLLLDSVEKEGWTILNYDDQIIKNYRNSISQKLILSSSDKNSDFYIKKVFVDINKFEITFIHLEKEYKLKIDQPLPYYYSQSFLLAIMVSYACGIEVEESVSILEESFMLPPGRFSYFKGVKNSMIIDSSYNSSLESLKGALEVLPKISKKRKIGFIGDMRELGSLAKVQHEEAADSIIKNLDFVILIGPLMNEFVAPILEKSNIKYKSFLSYKDIEISLVELIEDGDTILVKGSQNTLFLERIVEKLLENKSDVKKLPRRGEFWEKMRNLN